MIDTREASKVMKLPALSENVCSIADAMSIRFNTRVYELQRAGRELCVLSLGEAFFDLPAVDVRDLPTPAIFHYSDSRGIPELRSAISQYYRTRYGFANDPNTELLITAGSKAAIYFALLSILDVGDEVLVPEPAWVSYTEQIGLCRGVPVGIPYTEPVRSWERFITPKTRAVIINNPHNPTGYRYTADELRLLVELAREHGLWLLSDEAYSDFTPDERFVSTGHFDPDKSNVVVFNSISKNYGISGWRLGYVIARSSLIDQILKVNQHVITCPATILEYYIEKHFESILAVTRPQISALLDKRAKVAALLDGIGLEQMPGDSTFYFFVGIAPSGLGSEEFGMRLLEEKGVAVVPGIGYGASCDAFIRLSIGTEPLESIERALRSIKAFIGETSG